MEGVILFVFFFQAEDGIRDGRVTGVQTCALPISRLAVPRAAIAIVIADMTRAASASQRPAKSAKLLSAGLMISLVPAVAVALRSFADFAGLCDALAARVMSAK